MSEEITIVITKVNGQPTVKGIIGVGKAADILGVSANTVKNFAKRDKLIRYFWVNFEDIGQFMVLYRVDVMSLHKQRIKEQQNKLDQMKGSN